MKSLVRLGQVVGLIQYHISLRELAFLGHYVPVVSACDFYLPLKSIPLYWFDLRM
jgi:hypothetical protein